VIVEVIVEVEVGFPLVSVYVEVRVEVVVEGLLLPFPAVGKVVYVPALKVISCILVSVTPAARQS